ncbi:hypothetical protein MKZ38_007503 [Zalerion maritima]|uniref:Uncharacterized protein n=1 Tax=Zalerion maritima TaxID=339359 RepID=A0AAD5RIR8_9PEZI|nr:hypothetical protein MKZ38_007503 [Zalerion maritima]
MSQGRRASVEQGGNADQIDAKAIFPELDLPAQVRQRITDDAKIINSLAVALDRIQEDQLRSVPDDVDLDADAEPTYSCSSSSSEEGESFAEEDDSDDHAENKDRIIAALEDELKARYDEIRERSAELSDLSREIQQIAPLATNYTDLKQQFAGREIEIEAKNQEISKLTQDLEDVHSLKTKSLGISASEVLEDITDAAITQCLRECFDSVAQIAERIQVTPSERHHEAWSLAVKSVAADCVNQDIASPRITDMVHVTSPDVLSNQALSDFEENPSLLIQATLNSSLCDFLQSGPLLILLATPGVDPSKPPPLRNGLNKHMEDLAGRMKRKDPLLTEEWLRITNTLLTEPIGSCLSRYGRPNNPPSEAEPQSSEQEPPIVISSSPKTCPPASETQPLIFHPDQFEGWAGAQFQSISPIITKSSSSVIDRNACVSELGQLAARMCELSSRLQSVPHLTSLSIPKYSRLVELGWDRFDSHTGGGGDGGGDGKSRFEVTERHDMAREEMYGKQVGLLVEPLILGLTKNGGHHGNRNSSSGSSSSGNSTQGEDKGNEEIASRAAASLNRGLVWLMDAAGRRELPGDGKAGS